MYLIINKEDNIVHEILEDQPEPAKVDESRGELIVCHKGEATHLWSITHNIAWIFSTVNVIDAQHEIPQDFIPGKYTYSQKKGFVQIQCI